MTEVLTTIAIIFIIVGPFLLLANRYEIPIVPMLILAGIIAGSAIEEQITLELAQWGIALLVFFFGVQIRYDAVRIVLSDGERIAIAQVLIVGLLGMVVSAAIGLSIDQAIYFAIAAALSSTIVGTSLLQTDIRNNLVRGRLAESINFVQDLLAIFIVLLLGVESVTTTSIVTHLGYGVIFLLVASLVNRYLFDKISGLSGRSGEQLLVSIIAILVVFLGAAQYFGVSIVVGAFAAGIAIRYEPEEYYSVYDGLTSIRDFFVAIFFVTVGALVTIPTIEVFVYAVALGIITAIVKPAVTTLLLIYSGYDSRSATLTSLSLDQVSEFALIIAIEAMLLGVLLQSLFDAIIIAAAATMITSALTIDYDERIYRALAGLRLFKTRYDKIDERSSIPNEIADHVIIVGFGRQGKRLFETSERLGIPTVVVENDPIRLNALQSECESYIFSDANEPYTWSKANVADAAIVVSTVNSRPVSEFILQHVSTCDLVLRTDDTKYAYDLLKRGVLYVCVDEVLAAERLIEYIESLET